MGKTNRDRARGQQGSSHRNRHRNSDHASSHSGFDQRHSHSVEPIHPEPRTVQEWKPGQHREQEGQRQKQRREFIPNEFSARVKVGTLEGTFDPAFDKQVFVDLMPPTRDGKGRALKIKDKTGDRSAFVLIPDQGTAIAEFFGVVLRLMEHMGITAEQAHTAMPPRRSVGRLPDPSELQSISRSATNYANSVI